MQSALPGNPGDDIGNAAAPGGGACQSVVRGVKPALLIVAALAMLVGGCSPALDWRQVRPEGWGLVASLPCRPTAQSRQVALAGPAIELSLWVCNADGHTFALTSADVADPARVGPALLALGAAAQANVRGTIEADRPAAVPGMTPQPAARQWRFRGLLPDGQPVREQVLVFAHGLRVFQATLVGPIADDAIAKVFFDSIELPR